MITTVHTVSAGSAGDVQVSVSERGHGRPVLLLHGGGGPITVNPWADRLAAAKPARVLTPVHPGFGGTSRPTSLASVRALAATYVALLDVLDLQDVTVVGNSIGGWIAAEMALLESPRISGVVVVDGVGIEVPGHPVADFFAMSFSQLAEHSYADPARYGIDLSTLPPEALQAMAGNRAALEAYAGREMTDPTLHRRLAAASVPTLVVWGEADRIGDPDFGRAFAAAIPGAEFHLLENAGHLPQIEAPEALIELVWSFVGAPAPSEPDDERPGLLGRHDPAPGVIADQETGLLQRPPA